MYMLKLYRLEIQAKVRHLGRNPGTTAQQSIESAREQLTALVHELKRKTLAAGVVEVHSSTCRTVQEPLGMWDEVVNEPMPGGPAQGDLNPAIDELASTGATPIKNQMLPFPSNGNVGQEHAPLELSYRIQHYTHLPPSMAPQKHSTLPSPTVSERNRAVPSGSECFRVFPTIFQLSSERFRAVLSNSERFRSTL